MRIYVGMNTRENGGYQVFKWEAPQWPTQSVWHRQRGDKAMAKCYVCSEGLHAGCSGIYPEKFVGGRKATRRQIDNKHPKLKTRWLDCQCSCHA